MQKARKKWSCIALAVSLAVLPMRAAAEEPTAFQNDLDTPSKGIIYQSAFDLETSAGDRMQELLCFVQDSGFNRIYFDPSGQAEKALPQLPAIRIRPNEEKALEELSALTELLEEN